MTFASDDVIEFRYAGSEIWRKAGCDSWRVKSAIRAGAEFDAKLKCGTVVRSRPHKKG